MNEPHLRGYKIKIYPTKDQEISIQTNIDTYRAVYNLALEIQNTRYFENKENRLTFFSMEKLFSDMRNNNSDYKWLNNITVGVIREALADLDNAFKCFFSKTMKNRFPKFKSKKKSKKSFGTRSDKCHADDQYIYISGIGYVYASNHNIPKGKRLYDTRVSYDGYDYWFSCQVDTEYIMVEENDHFYPIGIDVGIRNLITTSDGDTYHLPDNTKLYKRLKRQQRRLSKYYNHYLAESMSTRTKYDDIPKSKNMQKKLKSQRKTYDKIRNRNLNASHTATKQIVSKNPSIIVIEDIKVDRLMIDKWFKKRYSYTYMGEIRRQIEYKAADRNIPIIVADSNYPSSQICSNCGNRHKIYSNKIYKCPICGLRIDRDLNAAYNLRNLAYLNNS